LCSRDRDAAGAPIGDLRSKVLGSDRFRQCLGRIDQHRGIHIGDGSLVPCGNDIAILTGMGLRGYRRADR